MGSKPVLNQFRNHARSGYSGHRKDDGNGIAAIRLVYGVLAQDTPQGRKAAMKIIDIAQSERYVPGFTLGV